MGKIVGIDLHLKRPSVIAVLRNFKVYFLETGEEIGEIIRINPEIVVIDAPLSLKIPFREFERELMKVGYKFLPLSLPSMRRLTKKAIKIKNVLEKKGMKVFETHPGSLSKWIKVKIKNKDRKDAFLCAFAGYLYKKSLAKRIENFLFL